MSESEFLHNVKEHAPPPMESQNLAEEPPNGGCCVSTCCASSFDEDDDELEDDSEGWFYLGVKKEDLDRTLTEMKLILECALSDDPSINLSLLINPNGKGKMQQRDALGDTPHSACSENATS